MATRSTVSERPLLYRVKDEYTDSRYGCRPEDRDPETHIRYGVLNLDKPRGPTSHEVVAWIKRMLNIPKAGHAGTLDPKVSGVLPVALAEATKVLQALAGCDKEYICLMRLHSDVPESQLLDVLKEFIGPIYQRPPLRSAVKRRIRIKHIYNIELLEKRGKDVLLRIHCESGTYVRKLCHDIGEALGVGAHMRELRRIRVGPFHEDENLVTLNELRDALILWREFNIPDYIKKVILPVEYAVRHIPKVYVRDSAVDAICHGASLAVPGIVKVEDGIKPGDLVAIMTLKNELVALGRAQMTSKEMVTVEKGIAVRTTRVIMKPGTYPPMWKKKKEAKPEQAGTETKE